MLFTRPQLQRRSFLTLLAVLSLATGLSGCGSDPGFDERVDFARNSGEVQSVNMIADSPQVNVLFGFEQSNVGFAFTSGLEVRVEDDYDWEIRYLDEAGETINLATGTNQTVTQNVVTTFLMFGTIAQPDIQIVNSTQLPVADRPENQTEVWFASNLSRFPVVDVYVTDHDAELGAPLASVTSGSFTNTFTVSPGENRQIRVMEAGTSNLLFDSGPLILVDQVLELFALVDDFGPQPETNVDVIRSLGPTQTVIADFSQAMEVRTANYSTQEPLSISLPTRDFGEINRGTVTGFLEATPGTQSVTFSSAATEIGTQEIDLFRGRFQSVLVFDNDSAESQPAVRAVVTTENFRARSDRALIQVINGSNDLIDVYALRDDQQIESTAPVFNDLGLTTSTLTELRPGNVRVVITNTDRSSTFLDVSLQIVSGDSLTYVIDSENQIHEISAP